MAVVARSRVWLKDLEIPKSPIFIRLCDDVKKMFGVFKSLWRMFFLWMYWRPKAIWTNQLRTSAS